MVTKNKLFLQWLQDAESSNPDEVAILLDGTDQIWGGCTMQEIMKRYSDTVSASGGVKLIASAAMGYYPNVPGHKQRYAAAKLTNRRKAILKKHGLQRDWVAPYEHCINNPGPCSNPPEYQYLNYGFMMGPVRDLRE